MFSLLLVVKERYVYFYLNIEKRVMIMYKRLGIKFIKKNIMYC